MIRKRALHALSCGAAVASVTGCGVSPPPIGVPGAAPQTWAAVRHGVPQAYASNWDSKPRAARATSSDLLYVSGYGFGDLFVFSYPGGKSVGEVSVPAGQPWGLCADGAGDVFVTSIVDVSTDTSEVYKYTHGGSEPIATLNDTGLATGCAIDPTTGNLAVTNALVTSSSSDGDVAVYPNASGEPTTYTDPNLGVLAWCTYDDAGDLYVDGADSASLIDELAQGGSGLTEITLTKAISPRSMGWVDQQLVAEGYPGEKSGPVLIYQVSISGSEGTVSEPVLLKNKDNEEDWGAWQFLLQGRAVIGPGVEHRVGFLEFWPYPKGGKPKKAIRTRYQVIGEALSHGS